MVRQLLEPALAQASLSAREDLFQGPAGEAVRLLGLPGASAVAHDRAAAPDASFAVLHGLYWLCANLASSSTVLIAVDDAHWGDVPSLRFLAFLLSRLDELAVSLLVATRPESDGAVAPLLSVLLADPVAHVLRPAPLSQNAVARIVKDGLGRSPAPSFTAACHRATGGLPFLVRELSWRCGPTTSSPRPRPPSTSRPSAGARLPAPSPCGSPSCPRRRQRSREPWR